MDQLREAAFDRILAYVDGFRPDYGAAAFDVGPFSLYWDYARPTLGSTTFTASDVRDLIRCANEHPPWASIARDVLLVEWNQLEWIVERVPELTRAVSSAGLTISTNPLLIKRSDSDAEPTPVPIDAEIETSRGGDRASGEWRDAVVRFRGERVAEGMHEPFLDVSEITRLSVLPPFRRRGFGTALAAALAADAFDHGVGLVFVESALEAVTMYERAGFQRIGAIARAPI